MDRITDHTKLSDVSGSGSLPSISSLPDALAKLQLAHVETCLQLGQAQDALSRVQADHADLSTELDCARRQIAQLENALAEVRAALAEVSAENEKRAAQTTRLRSALRESAAEREVAVREADLGRSRIAALESERDSLLAAARDLRQEGAYTRQALATMAASPGWQAILRYRRWLQAARSSSRLVRRWYEPLAGSLTQRLLPPSGSVVAAPSAPGAATEVPETPGALSYARWIQAAEPAAGLLDIQRRLARQLPYRPKISVIVPVYRVSADVLHAMVDSVRNQTYDNWELCIAHGDPHDQQARKNLANLAREDRRIRLDLLKVNRGISGNSNSALELCSGEFAAMLDHDDTLAPFALFEIASLLNENPALDFVYSDKDQLTENGRKRLDPLFKPRWSPDMMIAANYVTHLCVARTSELRAVGGWRPETDGAQDWDLFLRLTERSSRIAHLPKVLYHWRRVASSVASRGFDAKPYAAKSQLRAVQEHLVRRGIEAEVDFTSSGLLRLGWRGARPSVAVVVVVSGAEDSELYDALLGAEDGPQEIWAVAAGAGMGPPRSRRIRTVGGHESAGLAERLNGVARQSSAEVIVFIDSAVKPSNSEWLDELVYPLRDAGIGVVGAKLFDPQSSAIRHAGIAFGAAGALQYPFAGEHDYIWGPFGGANWYRNWLAVSGACFAVRRDAFLAAGGFARRPRYPRLDVDLCLNLAARGLRVLYNPFARLWQGRASALEQWLTADEIPGAASIREWFPGGDPYFNPNVASAAGPVTLRVPQREAHARDHNFSGEARALVRIFDCTAADIEDSVRAGRVPLRRRENRFTWFVPQFANPFYGGIHTILRFADYFRRAHDVRSSFVVLGHADPARVAAQIARVSPGLAETGDVRVVSDYDALEALETSDAAIASLWTTAYYLLRFRNAGRKFYFMQDYEPLFYPAGSTSALVEATYRFGFHGICNTRPLSDAYTRHGGDAAWFEPCVDRDVFFEPAEKPAADPYILFCYARPGHPRNCFELLAESLRKLKRRMGDKVAIVTAGESWNPAEFDLAGVVENLGLLDYRTTGAVYRMCHAGVTMMMTRHPSYLPLELMASGSLVVTNRNEHTGWLLRDRENCLLAETSPGAIAEAIEEGLRDEALRERITRTAAETIRAKYQNWDEQAERVYRYIAAKLES